MADEPKLDPWQAQSAAIDKRGSDMSLGVMRRSPDSATKAAIQRYDAAQLKKKKKLEGEDGTTDDENDDGTDDAIEANATPAQKRAAIQRRAMKGGAA